MTVVASASVPFVFPPTHLSGGRVMMDGGTVLNTNLISAADRCLEEVDHDSQIVMDVMMCDYIGELSTYEDDGTAYGNYLRNWAINSYYYAIQDITEFMRTRPNIKYRYLATASQPLTSGTEELNVTQAVIEPMIELGMKDGNEIISKQEGFYFQKLQEFDQAKESFKGTFSDFISQHRQ